MKRTERNSNVELLRCFAAFAVIILHYISEPGGLLKGVTVNSSNFFALVSLNQLCVCAVDLFVFISSYYLCEKSKISWKKPISIVFLVILSQVGFYTLGSLKKHSFSIKSLGISFIIQNYYIVLFLVLYILVPFLNLVNKGLKQDRKKFLITIILLFSVQPILIDVIEGIRGTQLLGSSTIGILGADWGYTIVTFILIYFIASYYKYSSIKLSLLKNIVLLIICWALLFGWKVMELKIGRSIGAEHYQNPIIIFEALLIFTLFERMNFQNVVVNIIASGTLIVYLLHTSLITFLPIRNINGGGSGLMLLELTIKCLIIFIVLSIVGAAYSFIESQVTRRFMKKQ